MQLWQRGLLSVLLSTASGAAAAAPPAEVAALKGQPVETIIAKLGAPGSEQKAGAGTAYAWTMETRVNVPTRGATTDYSSGRPSTHDTTVMRPQMQSCTLSGVADATGVITEADRQGPYEACSALARKLTGQR